MGALILIGHKSVQAAPTFRYDLGTTTAETNKIWNTLQETVTDNTFTVALLLFNIIVLLIIIKKIWVKPQPFGTKVLLERSDYHDCQTLEVLQVPFCLSLTIYQAFKDKTTIERLVFGHRYHRSSKYLLPVQNKLSSKYRGR